MNKHYEDILPENYKEVYHISATDKKFGIIFNIIALIVFIPIAALAFWLAFGFKNDGVRFTLDNSQMLLPSIVCLIAMIAYIVLHELVHGAAYKLLTKQKLTFGMSWSCAFCGVPNIYTYRKTALIALLAPFTLFTLILLPLCALLYFVNVYYFIGVSMILGIHLGGCSGDLYMTIILLSKFKDKYTLIRDTGPEQSIYIKE